jgi:hypothetical protein
MDIACESLPLNHSVAAKLIDDIDLASFNGTSPAQSNLTGHNSVRQDPTGIANAAFCICVKWIWISGVASRAKSPQVLCMT